MQQRDTKSIICLALAVTVLGLWGHAAAAEIPKNPNSAKACAICHYRWIDTFFVEGRGTDLVAYQSEKVAADPEMCFSCHDGSVMDSRARVQHGNAHKTNAKPPAGMTIPEIFPLDENGNVSCATCHTAHGVESGPGVKETIFLRVSNRDSAMCRMCHSGKEGGPAAGNHSLEAGEKVIPKSLMMRGAQEGSAKNQIICETCHTSHGAPKEGYLVTGAGDSGLCIACHADKNIFDPSGLRNANHVVNVVPQKAAMPEEFKLLGAKTGYGGVISCQSCHKIHNNKIKQPVLLVSDNPDSGFCLACHTDKQRIEKTKHNLAISAKNEKNLQGKTVAESGICSACHLPHKPARSLNEKYEFTDRTTALCMSCHAMGTIAENKNLTGYSHPVGVPVTESEAGNGLRPYRSVVKEKDVPELPLFNEYGVADKQGKMTCATCHDTHGGPAVLSDFQAEKDPAEKKNTLLRKPLPGLCRACHRDKYAVENSRHDMNHVFPDGNRILSQAVPEPALCRNCHYIHNSEPEGFVWSRQITTDAGEGVKDHCIRCHSQDGLAPEMIIEGNSHPVNISLTESMRDNPLPLFNVQGNVTDNGVMTCYTCHDPHRRSPVKSENGTDVIKDGRRVERFLRIDTAPLSDLCCGCHKDQAAVLRSDHNLVRTAPAARNTAGNTAFESGACGACHRIHNSNGFRLWAQNLGPGDHIADRMCNSCHSENGPAAEKIPGELSHPETIVVDKWNKAKGAAPVFPLFDKVTAARVKTGNMSCPSCHDAHHWKGNGDEGFTAFNAEGDATSSFLRPHLPDRVCRECHGIDALVKFKYFHKTRKSKINNRTDRNQN